MNETVDARGLSCPQPVMLTRNKMGEIGRGTLRVIVDTAASRDNITRMATHTGWSVQSKEEGEDIILVITRD